MDPAALQGVPLFSELEPADRERVARWADQVDVDTGHHLIRRDGFGYEFFVILEGTAEVMLGDVHLADM
ncbi:MAG: hypothetical protein QOH74_1142, partial [Gaiellales bacterium]|nr:hypothetical protein [Gaiellales bacterium]